MSYGTGTMPASTTPAKDFMDEINTLLTAHAGWSLVEQYTISGTPANNNNHVQYVYENTANSWGTPFYVGFFRFADSATQISTVVSEVYTLATHKFAKFCYTGVGWPIQADFSQGVVGTSDQYGDAGIAQPSFNVNASGYSYMYSITNDRAIFMSANGTGSQYWGISFAGVIQPFYPASASPLTADPFPLFLYANTVYGMYLQGNNHFLASREPGYGGGGSQAPQYAFEYDGSYMMNNNYVGWDAWNQKWITDRVALNSRMQNQVGGTSVRLRGLLPADILICDTNSTGYSVANPQLQSQAAILPNIGDTLVIDGVTYTCIGNNAPQVWVSQAA